MTIHAPIPPLVVIVEDDATVDAVEHAVLTDEGYRVEILDDPSAEAIAALHPDLILIDIILNRAATGFELLQTLKADPVTAAIPVLVVTAISGGLLAKIANQLTEWDCIMLPKPFDLEDLIAHVRDCLTKTMTVATSAS